MASQRTEAPGSKLVALLDQHRLAIVNAISSDASNSGRDRILRLAAQQSLRSDWGAMVRSFIGSPGIAADEGPGAAQS